MLQSNDLVTVVILQFLFLKKKKKKKKKISDMLKVQKQMCLFLFRILVLVWSSCMYSVHMHILKHLFYMIRMQVSGRGAQR